MGVLWVCSENFFPAVSLARVVASAVSIGKPYLLDVESIGFMDGFAVRPQFSWIPRVFHPSFILLDFMD